VRAPIRFAVLFLNGGPKSASSVEHAHAQIVAREDQHFAYPELELFGSAVIASDPFVVAGLLRR